jgi:hypothetical protein
MGQHRHETFYTSMGSVSMHPDTAPCANAVDQLQFAIPTSHAGHQRAEFHSGAGEPAPDRNRPSEEERGARQRNTAPSLLITEGEFMALGKLAHKV